MKPAEFKKLVWKYYKEHGRTHLPWRPPTLKLRRGKADPYKILVSEIMLQQTQVDRVIPKYKSFLERFPTAQALSSASLRAVLKEWQGLGYNRRAVNLKRTCETVVKEYGGRFPAQLDELLMLPGIGRATAGDLLAFAFNLPTVVIETNIRTVYIHHFFSDKEKVSDKEIAELVKATLPSPLLATRRGARGEVDSYREWYYALMDYGTHLKKEHGNNINKSTHHKKQSAFKGSNRELRSNILKLVLEKGRTEAEIMRLLDTPTEPVRKNLIALEKEGLIRKVGSKFIS